jgi:PIN domain nuclease of toxin-antitoxin system
VKVLLDTHAFLWFVLGDSRLGPGGGDHHRRAAQATVERIPLVSYDGALDAYSIQRLW